MNRLKSPLRRALAIAAGATIGLVGAVALAATPASAHYTAPTGSAYCDTATGEWEITWSVRSEWHFKATKFRLKDVEHTPAGTTLEGIAKTPFRDGYPYSVNSEIIGTQRVPGSTTEATLKVKGAWNDGYAENKFREGTIELGGDCAVDTPESPSPTPSPEESPSPVPSPDVTPSPDVPDPIVMPAASFLSDCEGTVWVTVSNGEDATESVDLTVTAGEFSETYTLEPGQSKDDIQVPGDSGPVTVTDGEETVGEPYEWTEPENCVVPGEPEGGYDVTCDQLIVGFANPEDGEAFTVTLTPSEGDAVTVTVEPGATEVVEFDAAEGFEVHVVSEEWELDETIAWELPEDCDTGGEGGGELPVTGAAAGGIAAGAVALLALGGGLFYLARRRRVTFTA